MTDITDRLRSVIRSGVLTPLLTEAADEIDRLHRGLYELYCALGEDTDGAHDYASLYGPMTGPLSGNQHAADVLLAVVREHIADEEREADRYEAEISRLTPSPAPPTREALMSTDPQPASERDARDTARAALAEHRVTPIRDRHRIKLAAALRDLLALADTALFIAWERGYIAGALRDEYEAVNPYPDPEPPVPHEGDPDEGGRYGA